jgi:hypothetical protein
MFFIGIRTYTISKEVRSFNAEEAQEIQGADPQLLETVTKLESDLKDRGNFVFKTDRDPLKLSAVVKSPKLLASMGYNEMSQGIEDMRLNLTIIGDNPYASIKYMGKYEKVKIGDTIAGWEVTEIAEKTVVLRRGSRTITLNNRPAPETLAEEADLEGESWDIGNY